MFDLSADDLTAIGLSVKVASVAILAALPLAIVIGYALARWRFPGHAAINALVHLPLVMPPVVTGFALLLLFGRHGPIGAFLANHFGIVFAFRWTGAALAAAVMSFPLMVRPVRLAFEGVDPRLTTAARSLGASRAYAFALVELPLAANGVLVGAILGFAKALGEFGATITFVSSIPGETRTIPAAIYALLQAPDGDASAMRLAAISAAIAVAALLASEALQSRWIARK
ncbi:molybdate ABC transporter permease subunit [Methylocystis sp. ATCC 49242]|uniref:molybdate ABC transporter permease subunit n=1 Tax=Methylocystis sp. ATCC 49242 TaxID=622637 RepID=UPI0001F87DE6|nr:molybdate ABC transporter permease subunit [Methylocystis sp. ATCC 49242]